MTREKKKMNIVELEDHVMRWALDQIEKLRCVVDEVNDAAEIKEQERLLVFSGIANQFEEILELIKKINHDERHVTDWVQNFIGRYAIIDDNEN